ncbi:hypothetical protein C0181_04485 [Moraxella catarrhalis]|nr:hypothetical protein [Moraxella catarrhalis]
MGIHKSTLGMIIELRRPILAEILSLFEYFNDSKYLKISQKIQPKIINQPRHTRSNFHHFGINFEL